MVGGHTWQGACMAEGVCVAGGIRVIRDGHCSER